MASRKQQQPAELKTLTMKEDLFVDHLTVNDDLLAALRDAGIVHSLTNEQLAKVSSNKEKARRLMAAVKADWKEEHFDKFCDVLETFGPWLGDELRTELQGEKGTLKISEAVELENSRIVFKEFGQEKRLSELEKKRLLKLLNRKTQCSRDIWEKQLNRINAKLDAVTNKNNAIDEESTRLAKEMEEFTEKNAAGNFQHRAVVRTARTTSDVLRDLGPVHQLDIQINALIQLSGQSMLETDNINDEKRRVAQRLDDEKKEDVKMDVETDVKLTQYWEGRKVAMADCKKAISYQQNVAEQITADIVRAKKERDAALAEKQLVIDDIREKVRTKDTENDGLRKHIEELQRELATLDQQLVHFTSRSTHLERGKRVQSLFEAVNETRDESARGTKQSTTAAKKSPASSAQLPKVVEKRPGSKN